MPIFFVIVGARVDLSVLNPIHPENRLGLLIAAFLIVVAIIGKTITGWAVFSKEPVNRLAVGVGMIPRGEVGLVFAGIGAASGTLDRPLQAAIIAMVILTTLLAPLLLRWAFRETATVVEAVVGGVVASLLSAQSSTVIFASNVSTSCISTGQSHAADTSRS